MIGLNNMSERRLFEKYVKVLLMKLALNVHVIPFTMVWILTSTISRGYLEYLYSMIVTYNVLGANFGPLESCIDISRSSPLRNLNAP